MVTLTFDFNMDKVWEAGYTTDELLAPMREHAKKYGIDEVEYGVFAMDGINALAAIGKYAVSVSPDFVDYLDNWILNVDGKEEDCIEALHRCITRNKEMIIQDRAASAALFFCAKIGPVQPVQPEAAFSFGW